MHFVIGNVALADSNSADLASVASLLNTSGVKRIFVANNNILPW
jgi:hypothetical protein